MSIEVTMRHSDVRIESLKEYAEKRMALLATKFPKVTKVQIVIDIVMLIFAVLMLVYGIQITKQFWNYTWTNIPSFKRGPTWMCLPICGGTASIYLVYQIYEEIMKLVHGGKA